MNNNDRQSFPSSPNKITRFASSNNLRMKLHLGCGNKRLDDFINIDLHPYDSAVPDSSRGGCRADLFADMTNLGLPENSVEEIFTSHTVDHFTRWRAIAMLEQWHRMIVPGGLVVIEMADFWRCIAWLFHPSQKKRHLARTQFYGNQWDEIDFETHRYLWSSGELKNVLQRIGFTRVSVSHNPRFHQKWRDMRVEAIK